ncbi:MAG: ribosome-associated translation inhibitor RaiA [Planctomycetota bacterium]|nr:ribosome-associated translation inhibitor RaiA [Planctomycetaceae bacterium]MDQ3331436.1 ribosome-associated translation inhibitor RaiA [Planctomycetota bacterium]
MQIEVTSRHGTVSDDVRRHLVQKAEKLLTYFERVTAIQVTVDFETPRLTKVEILVDAEHKHDFVANDQGEDVVATFDRVLHKMEQQVKRYKERIQDHRRDRPMNEIVSPDPVPDLMAGDSPAAE